MNRKRGFLALGAATALLLASAPTATAHGGSPGHHGRQPVISVLNDDVVAPFQLAVNRHRVYVADGGTGRVSRIDGGSLKTIATGPQPGDVAGVEVNAGGSRIAYTTTSYANGNTTLTVKSLTGKRKTLMTADLSGYERRVNPDRRTHYGVANPSKCVTDALTAAEFPVSYAGLVDSHPYAVAAWKGNSWLVADAGGNTILRVDRHGRVSTVAVLPSQPLTITPEMASAQGLPSCVGGVTYHFEAVPTDVEVGLDGMLYVTTLPGGPEDPSLGARGSVYRVDPNTGQSTRLATGFLGATSLAVSSDGTMYVAEFFAGRISKVRQGQPKRLIELPGALSVEFGGGHLYAGTMAPMSDQGPTGPGTVVRVF